MLQRQPNARSGDARSSSRDAIAAGNPASLLTLLVVLHSVTDLQIDM